MALMQWFRKDPKVAAKELHATMRDHDFAAETAMRISTVNKRHMMRRAKNLAPHTPQRAVLDAELRNIDKTETACANAERLLHALYHCSHVSLVALEAAAEAHKISKISIGVRQSDSDVLKNSVSVARQLEHTDKILDAIDTIVSFNDAPPDDPPGSDDGPTSPGDGGIPVLAVLDSTLTQRFDRLMQQPQASLRVLRPPVPE